MDREDSTTADQVAIILDRWLDGIAAGRPLAGELIAGMAQSIAPGDDSPEVAALRQSVVALCLNAFDLGVEQMRAAAQVRAPGRAPHPLDN